MLRRVGGENLLYQAPVRRNLAGSEARFAEAGIDLKFKTYPAYPPYPQLREPLVHEVSILDLVANVPWEKIPNYIWG